MLKRSKKIWDHLSPVFIQTQSLALRALRKWKPQETQAIALASSQSWLPLLWPSIPIGCAFAVFIYSTHATQAIAFGWKPGFIRWNVAWRRWLWMGWQDARLVQFDIDWTVLHRRVDVLQNVPRPLVRTRRTKSVVHSFLSLLFCRTLKTWCALTNWSRSKCYFWTK